MTMPGVAELLIIFAVFVLLFGARKLPDLGKGIGEAIRGLREGVADDDPS